MRLLVFFIAVVLSSAGPVGAEEGDFQLTSDNLAAWQTHIRATADELAPLEGLDWQPTFADGLQTAAAQGKPVLLWTMNGHPLGCT